MVTQGTPVGRRGDLDALVAMLEQHRLVTVTGPGGIGKTTLSVEVMDRIPEAGITVFVDLSAVEHPDEVDALLARALRVTDQSARPPFEQVVRHLGERTALIVLDNCEHVLPTAGRVATQLVRQCPGVRVLATSTARLGVYDEFIYELPPLAVPIATDDLDTVRATASVRLLTERARQVAREFEVTDANRADVVELSQRLDGIPLAIELAAVRLRVLSPAQLVERLDQRFSVLTGGATHRPARHQTLRALVDWSYERCSDEERVLWARLSVFRGDFSLEAAETVCGFGELQPDRVLDVLDGLISRSMLVVDRSSSRVRYRQLATIRDYGAELLAERGESAALHAALLDHYLRLARQFVQSWYGPDQPEALALWRLEHTTMLSAVEWGLTDPARHDATAELLILLRYHWIAGGQLTDGRRWLDRALDQADLAPTRRAELLGVASWVALIQGDHEAAGVHLAEATPLVDGLGDPLLQARIDVWVGLKALFAGDLRDAIPRFEHVIDVFAAAGEESATMTALFMLAHAQAAAGDNEGALESAATGLAIADRRGERWNRAYLLWAQSLASWHLRHYDRADAAAREALQLQQDFGDGLNVALLLLVRSWVAGATGHPDRATRLADAAHVVWRLIGTQIAALGPNLAREDATRTPRHDGVGRRPVTLADAIAVGLEEDADATGPLAALTPREREVLGHLVQGRSNRAIAEALVISARTAEGHVQNILTKLGLASRSEVPGWFAANA